MSLETIYEDIVAERQRQIDDGYTAEVDDSHSIAEWLAVMVRHLGLAGSDGGLEDDARFLRQMIRVAALAVAALESGERRLQRVAGRHTPGKGW